MADDAQNGDGLIPLELTAAQRGMWFAENLSQGYSVNIAQFLDIRDVDKPLDTSLFVRVAAETGHDLELAFTRIVDVDGIPRQIVDQSIENSVRLLDLRHESDPEFAARQWMNADYQSETNLLEDRLVESALIRVADDRHLWYLRAHHIALDGYAALTAVREVLERYNAELRGLEHRSPVGASLAEIVADDQKYQMSSRRESDRAHWAETVQDLPERVTLARRAATVALVPQNLVAGRQLTAEEQDVLDQTARATSSSAAVLLTAAFSAYLARAATTDDVVLSLPVTGRATAKIKRGSGMLANMLPVRARDVSRSSMRGLIEQMQRELTGALRHQRYRFEDIRTDAGLADTNTASFGPIVNLMFFDQPIEIEGAEVDYRILSSGILEDLRLNIYQASPGAPVTIDLHGNPNLYDQSELQTHHDRFLTFLFRAFDAPDTAIADVDLLMPGELEGISALGIGPQVDSADGHLLDEFVACAEASPDAAAAVFEDDTWSYGELDDARKRWSARLWADGVRPGDRVVVALDRSIDQVAALYAILTLGAAYVPVDPHQPAERRALIVDAVKASVVVDDAYRTAESPTSATSWPGGLAGGGAAPAYVIFTSGSTGTPKGVQVSHLAVRNRLAWMQDMYPIDRTDAVLYKTPYTFDVSVWELLWPLMYGARMVITRPDGHRDPDHLRRLITATGVTVVHFVPSMLDVYTEVVAAEGHDTVLPDSVRYVFTSGEALAAVLALRLLEGSSARLINLYGPTEAAVDVTAHEVSAADSVVPIGRAVANTDVFVLDSRLRPVPVGVCGELYLSGRQLADGYLNRPALTAERFVANPMRGEGARMYRTGDLVRWSSDGELEYLGRSDFQIKIRGQRVELGEVEAVLGDAPGVDAAAVVARTDLGPAPVLVAYVRGQGGSVVDESTALAWCRRNLPSHMVPQHVVVLEQFPTNASGKLDRKALPEPTRGSETVYVAPRTTVERALADAAASILGIERVGLRDNLFSLGADSLSAARLVSRVKTEYGVEIGLADLFGASDVGEVADRARAVDSARPRLIRVADRPSVVPLSPLQTRLWFINRMDPTAATYNMAGAIRLADGLDEEALRGALFDIVERHESLRTCFPMISGEPAQQILAPSDPRCPTLQEVAGPADADFDTTAVLTDLVSRGFDLVTEVPLRVSFVRDGDAVVVVIVLHHIAGDGFSLTPLIRDLLSAYRRRHEGVRHAPAPPPLAVQYADYTLWNLEILGSAEHPTDDVLAGLRFWRHELAGVPDVFPLPTDRPRPPVASGRGGYVDVVIDGDTARRVRNLAAAHAVTPFTVLHAALSIVLSRWSGHSDVPIGTATAGRDEPELADLVGMFVNTVVLRTQVEPDNTVAELLAQAHSVLTRATAHADIPFDRIVEDLTSSRTASHTPLFQVAFTMYPGQATTLDALLPGAQLVSTRIPAAKFDLSVSVTDRVADSEVGRAGYDVEISYATDIFDESTVSDLGQHLVTVLKQMVSDPEQPVGAVDLVHVPVVGDHAADSATLPEPATLAELLTSAMASANPDALAISADGETTWASMAAQVSQLACELSERGVGAGSVVATAIPRSRYSVLATLAVAVAGAAFVSIDPAHPPARRTEILADSGAQLGLGVASVANSLPLGVEWLILDDPATELRVAGHSSILPRPERPADDAPLDELAYLIYTSGSTGKPKAAAVTHRGLANMMANQRRILGLDQTSRVLHVASSSFDASVFEILMSVGCGGTLVVSPAGVFGGAELEELIEREEVTHAVMTPSSLATIDAQHVPSLATVISVGEACPEELARRWRAAGRRFFNLYGPTEATIWATAAGPLGDDEPVTIGTEVAGVCAYVLDNALRPTPVGVPGEIYLAGTQLARGYHGRADLTCSQFVADPFGSGRRMYRTGDRVLRDREGRLRYLGRIDFQLKIRGLRIEPGEVDDALTSHPAVTKSVTLAVPGPNGDDVLASYVTVAPGTGTEVRPRDLLLHASGVLPEYMVPRAVTIVDELPLTLAGKVDRHALPPVDFHDDTPFVAPRTQLETLLADVYGEVLGTPRVSVVADFFEIGGNSLSATKVAARVAAVLDQTVPVRAIFEHPTVSDLARELSRGRASRAALPLRPRRRAEMVPVSEMQRGLWLINRADPVSAVYNMALALRLEGDLDEAALDLALQDLMRRHEALRTIYPMVNGTPIQVIMPEDGEWVDEISLRMVPAGSDLPAAIAAVTGKGFDVTEELPVRAALLSAGADSHVLVVVVHHISADGASMSVLARDLMIAYSARHAGLEPGWRPLAVQYADYSMWQTDRLAAESGDVRERDRQLDYWKNRLEGIPDLLELPTDRSRPKNQSFIGGAIDFEIPADLSDDLESVAHQRHSTMFMVTQAAFAVLLSRLSGRNDIVIGSPFAGRGEEGLDSVVGMFVNTLALRTTIDAGESFADLLSRVRRDDLADMSNADVAFDTIAAALGIAPSPSHNPVFQAMFAYQNLEFPALRLGDLTVTPLDEELTSAKVDLQLSLFPRDPSGGSTTGSVRGQLLYATDLFDRATVERFAQRYLAVLRSIVRDIDTPVADLSIRLPDELDTVTADSAESTSITISESVIRAALRAPDGVAVGEGSGAINFSDLDAMVEVMAASTPDRDSALTIALMTLVPDLASGGAERLDDVLTELENNAAQVIDEQERISDSGDSADVVNREGSA